MSDQKKLGKAYADSHRLMEKELLLEKIENAKKEGKEWKVSKLQKKLSELEK